MKINVIRGRNQIGGSIVEISTDTTRIILDAGVNLDEGTEIEVPKIEGLFFGEKKYHAVFVSHYHPDHMGLLEYVIQDIPIYMGEKAYRIVQTANCYREIKQNYTSHLYRDNESINVGDMKITPILCDHSAFDSYMFLIEADDEKILYTGDFRANGRMKFDELLKKLPEVDSLIIEGTTLSRDEDRENVEEELLVDIAVKALERHKGPAFIMMSAMNVERVVTAYQIAQKTNRVFLEDLYTASIAKAAGKEIPQPGGMNPARVFMTGGVKQYTMLRQYGRDKIGKHAIAKLPFLMCIRPSMKNYLEKLNALCSFEDGILFYGMWKGYLEQPEMKMFIEFLQQKGIKMHILHTSGHADKKTIEKLIEVTKSKTIIPIHTENAKWFEKYNVVKK